MRRLKLLMLISSAALPCACSKPADAPARPPAPASAAAATAPPWLGRWQGPEGTYLEIAGGPGSYMVTVSNLDGPRSFEAKEGTDTLVFTRDGVLETLRAGAGSETGMKWLADKRDCLIVKAGEAYCRG
jgi:hypothetical protein